MAAVSSWVQQTLDPGNVPMPVNTQRLLVCIIIGVMLTLVHSTAGAFAAHMKDLNGASFRTSFSASRAGGAVGLAPYGKPKAEIADMESGLKHTSLGLGVYAPNKDYGHGPIDVSAEDPQLSLDLDCSTDVILAVFFKSRHCKTGTLVVIATSELAEEANLELIEYGRMKWDSKSQMWFIKIPDVETNPEIVVVGGAECLTDAPVLTMPHGCDAKIPLDLAG
jgi:hypothetical protein